MILNDPEEVQFCTKIILEKTELRKRLWDSMQGKLLFWRWSQTGRGWCLGLKNFYASLVWRFPVYKQGTKEGLRGWWGRSGGPDPTSDSISGCPIPTQ